MKGLLRARLVGLAVVSLMAGLVTTVTTAVVPTTASASSCSDTEGRAYIRTWETGSPVEHWTGTNRPHPPGNGFVPKGTGATDTVIVEPFDYIEFGGDGISRTATDPFGSIISLGFAQGANFDFSPQVHMWADSSCTVVPGESSTIPPNQVPGTPTSEHWALINPAAPAGVYTISTRYVCAAHSATVNCSSIVHNVVTLDYRNPRPNTDPNEPLFMTF